MLKLVSQLYAVSKRLHFTSIRYNYEVPFRDKNYFNISDKQLTLKCEF